MPCASAFTCRGAGRPAHPGCPPGDAGLGDTPSPAAARWWAHFPDTCRAQPCHACSGSCCLFIDQAVLLLQQRRNCGHILQIPAEYSSVMQVSPGLRCRSCSRTSRSQVTPTSKPSALCSLQSALKVSCYVQDTLFDAPVPDKRLRWRSCSRKRHSWATPTHACSALSS